MLRHACVSITLEAGEPVVISARWLGHSSPSITLGYYAHFMPEAGSKERSAIGGLLGKQGEPRAGGTPRILPRIVDGRFPLLQPLRNRSWIARLKRRVAWENAERGHRDPLHHTPA